MELKPVDACDVLVLVDNVSDILSTVPDNVTAEIPNVLRAGAQELSGRCLCCAQWGLSLIVSARSGDTQRTMLFDSGPEDYGVDRNSNRLGVDLAVIDAAVFSHGHWTDASNLSCLCRALCPARITPVDPLQQVSELGSGDLHRFAGPAGRPDELPRFQPFVPHERMHV